MSEITTEDNNDNMEHHILSENKEDIEFIYHISDIHIVKDTKFDEYKLVFKATYQILKDISRSKRDKSICVITGDVMDSKTLLSPEDISMTTTFIYNLSKIMPTFVIPGNHDCNMINLERLDALSPIFNDITHIKNAHYLKYSGYYYYRNVLFGVSSVLDGKMLNCKVIKDKDIFKIGLYHGLIDGASFDVGGRVNKGHVHKDFFKHYDITLLGDAHLSQEMNKEKTIAYAGSLIQQNYGEGLKHGLLKWSILNKSFEFIQIPNIYGYFTVIINKGKYDKKETIEQYGTCPENSDCKKIRLRLILKDTDKNMYHDVIKHFKEKYEIIEVQKEYYVNKSNKLTNIIKSNDKLETYKVQNNMIIRHLESKNMPKEEIDKMVNLHEKIYKEVNKKNLTQSHGRVWNIIELKFSNMLSYGENNIIQFSTFEKNKTISIIAPNHYGKSAILDIMLFCLFDKFTRGERRDILNKKKDNFDCSLKFECNDVIYKIERKGTRTKDSVKVEVFFYEYVGKERKMLNETTVTETNKKIIAMFGDYQDYLATSFSLQDKNTSLINMSHADRKDFLFNLLKLNVFEDCYQHVKDLHKILTGEIIGIQKMIDKTPYQELKDEHEKLKNKLFILNYQEKHYLEVKQILIKKLNIDENIPLDVIKVGKKDYDDIKEKLEEHKKMNKSENIDYSNEIKTLTKKIEERLKELKQVDKIESMLTLDLDETKKKMDEELKLSNTPLTRKDLDKMLKSETELTNKLKELKKNELEELDENDYYRVEGSIILLKRMIKEKWKVDHDIDTEIKNYKEKLVIFNPKEIKKRKELNEEIKEIEDKLEKIEKEKPILSEKLYHYDKYLKYKNHCQYLEYKEYIKNQNDIDKLKKKRNELEEKQKYFSNDINWNNVELYLPKMKCMMMNKEFNKLIDEKIELINDKYIKCVKDKERILTEIDVIKRKIKENNKRQVEVEEMEKTKELYQKYLDLMYHNGLPYEILKLYIPQIENEINKILENMDSFEIEIILNSDEGKKNTTVDINIVNDSTYNIQICSGFERFIVSLAIRIVLGKISMTAKPNFIIIDEGWSCFDQENLKKIDNIMTYLRTQFDHTIIISHLDELKRQGDYKVNIEKIDGFSHICLK